MSDIYIPENQTVTIGDEMYSIHNTDKFPIIDHFLPKDVFFFDKISEEYKKKHFGHYTFHGMYVPRVTHIIEATKDQTGLKYWAARVGFEEMNRVSNTAMRIGEIVHNLIEHYLITKEDLDLAYKYSKPIWEAAMNSYINFKQWILFLNSHGYYVEEILAIEYPIICTLYGGTIDCVARINQKNYILDFKTSKEISYDYILQICAYYWAVNNGYAPELPHIDGIGIIRIDKYKVPCFEDLFLNEFIPYQREILEYYIKGWGTILTNYYTNIYLERLFYDYKKEYKKKGNWEDDRIK